MILIVFKYLTPKGFRGITFYPFVFLVDKNDKQNPRFVNHERIHIRQQIEMLVLPFFIWYGLEFLVRLVQYKNRRTAYHNISFEREAYQNEKDPDYLKQRSFWRFLKFL
ncbi:hypothetical protein EQG63_00670 [Flavobacterium amnicola]|uniref:DUF4157 domain-containing protein n=1 Tax=Flavobacterium amnicola TaxID=2506422 RepID=A0A4Q1K3T1_9FLAO|nr:hypothetical protein [Flavobacterium amnicola]RXR20476.1 hypothetical protein EQG63_00670 [Flavobacterium amnicola]